MNKNKKILLGVVAITLAGYYFWQKKNKVVLMSKDVTPTTNFIGADGKKSGEPCSFKMHGELISGKVSELDNQYCFSADGRRGVSI